MMRGVFRSFFDSRKTSSLQPDFSYARVQPSTGPLRDDDRLIFLHMEKTAGTTVHHVMSQHFPAHEICPERFETLGLWSVEDLKPYRYFAAHAPLRMIRAIPQPRKIMTFLRDPIARFLSHYKHWRSFGDDVIQANNLRNLQYMKQFGMKTLLSPQHLAVLPSFWNPYAHRLAGDLFMSPVGRPWRSETHLLEAALANMANFTTMGLTEYAEISFQRIAEDLGIPNRYGGERHNVSATNAQCDPGQYDPLVLPALDDETRHTIESATALDRHIYRAAHRLMEDRLRSGITLTSAVSPDMRTAQIDGHQTVVDDRRGGYMAYGPYCTLPAGRYRATLWLRRPAQKTGRGPTSVEIDVARALGQHILVKRDVAIAALSDDQFCPTTIEFRLDRPTPNVEFRLLSPGLPGLMVRRGVGLSRL